MRLLHISDLHFRTIADEGRSKILAAAREDLKVYSEAVPFDAVIFTGDLVFSGVSDEEFDAAFQSHIYPLIETINVPLDHVAVLPGNHDIDPGEINLQIELGLPEALSSTEEVNAFIDASTAAAIRNARLSSFYSFYDSLWSAAGTSSVDHLGRSMSFDTPDGVLAVSCANSAWRATGRPNDADKRKLLIGERQLEQLRSGLADAEVRLFACHHPPEWLAEFDEQLLERELGRHYDLALFGHTHSPRPVSMRSQLGDVRRCTAGSLFQSADFRNAFTIIDIACLQKAALFTFRSYVPSQDVFSIDTEMSPNGTFECELSRAESSNDDADSALVTTTADVHLALRSQLGSSLTLLQDSSTDRLEALNMLIEPATYFVKDSTTRLFLSDGTRPKRTPLLEWVSAQNNIAIIGTREAGKTAALFWSLYRSADLNDRFPIAVDYRSLGSGRNELGSTIRRKLLSAGVRSNDNLTDSPPLVVGIDNFNPTEITKAERISAFISSHPEFQFILTVHDDGLSTSIEPLKDLTFPISTCFLGNYGTREVRALVQQIYPDAVDDWDAIVESAVDIIVNQGIRRSPWSCVMVLLIFRYEPSLKHADVTLLVDKYLDLVLGKWQADPADSSSGMDYVNRRHFLTQLAVELDKLGTEGISETLLIEFASRYRAEYDLDINPSAFVNDLLRRKILSGNPTEIHFALDGLRQFFIALGASNRSVDIQTLLSRWDIYFDAIIHCCAVTRDREDILQFLLKEVASISDAMDAPASLMFTSIDDDVWGEHPGLEETLKALSRMGDVAGAMQSQSGRDQSADVRLESRDQQPTSNASGDVDTDALLETGKKGVIKLLQATALLSLCAQRSEYVPGQEFKAGVVSASVKSWGQTFLAACALTTLDEDQSKAEKERVLDDAGLSGKQIEAMLQFGIFADVLGLAIGTLDSPKLRLTLERLLVAPTLDQEDMITALLFASVAMMNQASGWDQYMRDVIDRFGSRPHVVRLMGSVIALHYFDHSLSTSEVARTEDVYTYINSCHIRSDSERRIVRSHIAEELRPARTRSAARAKTIGPLEI